MESTALVWRHSEGALSGEASPSLLAIPKEILGVRGHHGAALTWGMRSESTGVTAI